MADADPDRARRDAQRVLERDRYQTHDVPRPLRGVLHWIGERLAVLGDPLYSLLSSPPGLVFVGLVASGLTALGVSYAVRRRNLVVTRASEVRRRSLAVDPRDIERRAEEAERAGDLAAAVRLRFRAGVLRLEAAEVVPARADATTAVLIAEVPSREFPPLARAFDEIAYGGRGARVGDVQSARSGWPRVQDEARAAVASRSGGDVGERDR